MKKLVGTILVIALVLSMVACGAPSAPAATQAPAPGGSAPAPGGAAPAGDPESPTFEQLMEMDWAKIEEYAKKEGKVTYWVWHDEPAFQVVTRAFTEKYGIEVELVVSEKAAGEQKVLAEKDGAVGSIDVMKCGGEFTKAAIEGSLFAGPVLSKIEGYEVLDPGLSVRQEGVEHGGYLVPFTLNQTGLLYNPRNVTNPPQTWAELEAWIDANPKKFGFCIPEKGGTGQAFVHSVIANTTGGLDQYYGDTDCDPAKLEKWSAVWEWINSRKDKLTFTASNSDSISRMNQGELDLVVAWDSSVLVSLQNGELFKDAVLYIPEFGMTGGGDTNGLLKNAGNPAAGMLLINYLSGPEGQTILQEETKGYPARTDIPALYTMLPPEQMEKYRIPWTPACYKAQFIADFTKNVSMAG